MLERRFHCASVLNEQLEVARYVAMMAWSLKAIIRGPGDRNDLRIMPCALLPNAAVPSLQIARCMTRATAEDCAYDETQ